MGKILLKRPYDEIDSDEQYEEDNRHHQRLTNGQAYDDDNDSGRETRTRTTTSTTDTEIHRKNHKKMKKESSESMDSSSPTSRSKIHLRHDQHSLDIPSSSSPNVTVYAPKWVKKSLKHLAEESGLLDQTFDIMEKGYKVIDKVKLRKKIKLHQLQMIARNEPRNSSGEITYDNYDPEIKDKYILSLKDLVRQTIIIGIDKTTGSGGFKCKRFDQNIKVVIIDLSALEFKQPWNTGRLVLYSDGEVKFPKGYLDDEIFFQVCQEDRKTISEVRADNSGRYVEYPNGIYFDTVAYKKFVAYDVLYTGLALEHFAEKHNLVVHFKFLAYGTGHFAGVYKKVLNENLISGILDGLEQLFSGAYEPVTRIHNVELPFYDRFATHHPSIQPRIDDLCFNHHVDVWFSNSDALENTIPAPIRKYTIATTNCANPHASLGNCMTHRSIDGSIAENLKSKGNIFSPVLNKKMSRKYIKVELVENEVEESKKRKSSKSESDSKSRKQSIIESQSTKSKTSKSSRRVKSKSPNPKRHKKIRSSSGDKSSRSQSKESHSSAPSS